MRLSFHTKAISYNIVSLQPPTLPQRSIRPIERCKLTDKPRPRLVKVRDTQVAGPADRTGVGLRHSTAIASFRL